MLLKFNILSNALIQSICEYALLLCLYYIISFLVLNRKFVYQFAVFLQIIGCLLFFKNIFFYNHTNSIAFNIQLPTGILEKSLPYVGIAYVVILLVLMINLFIKYFYINTVAQTTINYPIPQSFLQIIKQYLTNKNINIIVSSSIQNPFTYGFFKPVIVLPFVLCNSLTAKEMELVLLHEAAHILRNDYIVNLMLQLISTILFFNPFSQLLKKAIEQEREFCCDDWVLQQIPEKLIYANTLFTVAKQQLQVKQPLLFGLGFSQPHYLLQRILRITNQKHQPISYRYFIPKLTYVIVLLGAILINFSSPKKPSEILLVENVSKKVDKSSTKIVKKEKVFKNVLKEEKRLYTNTTFKKPKYSALDKQRLKDGFIFLSELAKENAAIKNILLNNPTIETLKVNNSSENEPTIKQAFTKKATETTKYFYVAATKTSKAKIITITVIEKENKDQKVIIEIEEINKTQRL